MKIFTRILLFLILLLATTMLSATRTWVGSGSGNWSTASNWSDGIVPISSDDVVLDNSSLSGSYTVTLDALSIQTIKSIQIGYSGNSNTITLIVSGGTNSVLTVSGGGSTAINIMDGGVLSNQSSSSTRGIKLSNASDVFKMSGSGKYIHATSSASYPLPERTSGTTNANYDFATTSTFELQTATFDYTPNYGTYNYKINATNSLGTGTNTLTINGDLNVLQGTFGVGSSGTNTINIVGNVVISSGTTFQGSSGSGTQTINIAGNISGTGTFQGSTSGGTTTNITVGGSISSLIGFSNQTTNVTFSGGSSSVNFTPANGTTPTVKNITIANGKTVTLGANISSASGTTITVASGGQLNCGTNVISGSSGTFTLASGGTLGIGSTSGITSSASSGNIQTLTRNYAADANYIYNCTSAQVTGSAFTSAYNLTINNSSGVSLSTNAQVTGTLTLTSGLLTLGSSSLSLGNSATISGSPSASNMIVVIGSGYLTKGFSGTGSFTFPVGDNTGTAEYSPATLNFTSGTFSSATASVNISNSKHSNNTSSTSYIDRYWTVASSGISSFSCDVSFTYVDADIHGTESNIYLGKYSSGAWALLNAATTATNQLTGTVSSFSDFTGGESAALPVELTSFTSNVVGNKVELNWKTATEVNNYGFEVQRLAVSNQLLANSQELNANGWSKIGFVQGNGNSNSPKNYSYTDQPTGGKEFKYRLKQIDFDGAFEYSYEVTAKLGNVSTYKLDQNYPNPFNPITKISYTIPQKSFVRLRVYDMLAKQIAELVNVSQEAGRYEVTFDGTNLPSGAYFYKLETGNYIEVKKLLLVK